MHLTLGIFFVETGVFPRLPRQLTLFSSLFSAPFAKAAAIFQSEEHLDNIHMKI